MYLYLVELTGNGEYFHKIGISYHENWDLRFTKYGKDDQLKVHEDPSRTEIQRLRAAFEGERYVFPYQRKLVERVKFSLAGDAFLTEQEILGVVYPVRGYQPKIRFDGQTECFEHLTREEINAICEHMRQSCEARNASAPPLTWYRSHFDNVGDARDLLRRHRAAIAKCEEVRDSQQAKT